MTATLTASAVHIALTEAVTAHNYDPLPIVVAEAEGSWVTDVNGRRYLNCLAAYSALNFGRRHPTLIAAAHQQLDHLTLTDRAFHNDQLGPFGRDLAALAEKDWVLPMNSGAEAVETAIEFARRWGQDVKGVQDGWAGIILARNNFHGRTTTLISVSTDPVARRGYAPFTPGFIQVPFGDSGHWPRRSLRTPWRSCSNPSKVKPASSFRPPDTYPRCGGSAPTRRCCSSPQRSSPGSAAAAPLSPCDVEEVVPDMYILGKALGGGIVPVSAVVANQDVLGVITPGSHGSTFGGNPLAAAIGRAVIGLLETGELQERARSWANGSAAGCKRSSGKASPQYAPAAYGQASTSTRQ